MVPPLIASVRCPPLMAYQDLLRQKMSPSPFLHDLGTFVVKVISPIFTQKINSMVLKSKLLTM